MSDLRSALPEARYEGAVTVEEAGLRGMITLKGDLGAAKLKKAAATATGVTFPGQGEARCEGENGLLWMAPDEVLILVPYADVTATLDAIRKSLKGTAFLAENVSDARAVFTVSGPSAREVLAKVTPADLRPASFPTGRLRRTRLAQVPAAFWLRDETTFEVVAFRSVAEYVFALLKTAADPAAKVEFFDA